MNQPYLESTLGQGGVGGIDNQSLITGFSISISYMLIEKPLPGNTSMFSHSQ
ncbi:MAG: hypothetical protein ACKPIF_04825 [Microcystis panniformis]|uniref:hypothetical protein n=1 Tax=Microcystis sp. LEGE 08355 TaxID=1828687 RepID=UPI000A75CB14|nr:hypothetical protein [Microcystis sp. LEGE 08355]